MNEAQLSGRCFTAPASVATSATVKHTVDRIGFDYLVTDLEIGTSATNGDVLAVCQWAESDDTVATNFTTISGLVGGTNAANGFTIPAVGALASAILQFQIDLRARKRYLQLQITNGTNAAAIIGVNSQLHRYEQAPISAAQKSIVNKSSTSVTAVSAVVRL